MRLSHDIVILISIYCNIPVQSPTRESCHSYKPIRVQERSGYLASVVTMETGYGSSRCPWRLKVSSGQRINITLLDFGTRKNLMQKDTTYCPVYAKIKVRILLLKMFDLFWVRFLTLRRTPLPIIIWTSTPSWVHYNIIIMIMYFSVPGAE